MRASIITLDCARCGDAHRVTVYAEADDRSTRAVEDDIPATDNRICRTCGNPSFRNPCWTDGAEDMPVLLVGSGVPVSRARCMEDALLVGVDAAEGHAVALAGDLSLGVAGPPDDLERHLTAKGIELWGMAQGDPSAVTSSRPCHYPFEDIRRAREELEQLGLGAILPYAEPSGAAPETEALGRALGLVVAKAVSPAPVSFRVDEPPRFRDDTSPHHRRDPGRPQAACDTPGAGGRPGDFRADGSMLDDFAELSRIGWAVALHARRAQGVKDAELGVSLRRLRRRLRLVDMLIY